MANEEHLAILRQGVEVWNRWREENPKVVLRFEGAKLPGMSLVGVKLSLAFFKDADLEGCDFTNAQLSGTFFQGANLVSTNFHNAFLSTADFRESNLTKANFSEALLFLAVFVRADLTDSNFTWALLHYAKFRDATLRGANLHWATLHSANLAQASACGANLTNANLRRANLQGINLSQADLSEAILTGATLTEADLTDTIMSDTSLDNLDLSKVHGLETVQHKGPSTIGIDTLYKSRGQIPETFLRGCGVPDSMIEYARALVAAERPIDYYSCFISYSSQDEALAERLYADLQARGVRCWYAPHDMQIGEPILSGIDRGIRLHDKLLLILSESSVESGWVEQEVHMALAREKTERRRVLFPIRIDNAVIESRQGWPAVLRNTIHIGDFCQWKEHDSYQAAFARLLRDLKAEKAG